MLLFARMNGKFFNFLKIFGEMRAKILMRFYVFQVFIHKHADIGQVGPPSRQLFVLHLFVFHKQRPIRSLNGLYWSFEFSIFYSIGVIFSAMQQNFENVFNYVILDFCALKMLFSTFCSNRKKFPCKPYTSTSSKLLNFQLLTHI